MDRGKKFGLLFLFISVSFLGLLGTQYLWVRNNIIQSNTQFENKAKKLISGVVETLEQYNYCFSLFSKVDLPRGQQLQILASADSTHEADTIPLYFHYYYPGRFDSLIRMDEMLFSLPAEIQMNLNIQFLTTEIDKINEPIEDLHAFERHFEDSIINIQVVDSLLSNAFRDNGITQDFHFLLKKADNGEILYSSNPKLTDDIMEAGMATRIFSESKYYEPYDFFVYFPRKNVVSIGHNLVTILSSFVLMVMFVLLFITFYRMLTHERKLSEMKVDFVNNITHELRTPLSNIKLATNALKKENASAPNHLIDIIEEENERLQKGIDLALTTSLLNKDELILNKENIDMHDLLQRIVQASLLLIKKHDGELHLDLQAAQSEIPVDELHITNVINNLMFNALKYSGKKPELIITTRNTKQSFEIEVADNGIGIGSNDLPYIFDRFYRVSTKNRHETSGYGIGLYYVKMIIEAHGGRVSASSAQGEGTTFKITLPLHD